MSKCKHNRLKMGYVEAAEYAQKQLDKGLRQIYCPKCNSWLWPCEIVPRKAKPKWVKVKGWCDITYGAAMWVEADNMVSNAGKRIPCYIMVRRQDLKGRKG